MRTGRGQLYSPRPTPEERAVELDLVAQAMAPTPFPDDLAYRQTHIYVAGGFTAVDACAKTGLKPDQFSKRTKKHRQLLQGETGPPKAPPQAATEPDSAVSQVEAPDQAEHDIGA
jgi:hypothetical protein